MTQARACPPGRLAAAWGVTLMLAGPLSGCVQAIHTRSVAAGASEKNPPQPVESPQSAERPALIALTDPASAAEQLTLAFAPVVLGSDLIELIADITTERPWRGYQHATLQGLGPLVTLKSERFVHCFIECQFTDRLRLRVARRQLAALDLKGVRFTFRGPEAHESPGFSFPKGALGPFLGQ